MTDADECGQFTRMRFTLEMLCLFVVVIIFTFSTKGRGYSFKRNYNYRVGEQPSSVKKIQDLTPRAGKKRFFFHSESPEICF